MNANAEGEWATITIQNDSKNTDITFAGLRLECGKLYKNGNKDKEVSEEEITNTIMKAGNSYDIFARGQKNPPSGTEGFFRIVSEAQSKRRVVGFYWDSPLMCPNGSWDCNKAEMGGGDGTWSVEVSGFNLRPEDATDEGFPLGKGKLTCVRKE